VVSFTPRGKSPWYPLDRKLGGPQSQSGRSGEEKNFQVPHKSAGIDQISSELIQAGGNTLHSEINLLILFLVTKNCHSSGRNLLLYLFKERVIKLTVIIVEGYHCYQLQNFIQHYFLKVDCVRTRNYWGPPSFLSNGYRRFFPGTKAAGTWSHTSTSLYAFMAWCLVKHRDNFTLHELFIDIKKAHVLVRREVLYNTLIKIGIPVKLVGLINICSNESCSKVRVGKNASDAFHSQIGVKQGDALSPLLFNFCFGMCHQESPRK